jgi:uncharacterized protein (TIGR03086 family)
MIDIAPATRILTSLVDGVRDEQLAAATPCEHSTLGDLLDHVDGLSLAFAAAAAKEPLDGPPQADGSRLGAHWRERIATRQSDLAEAWRDPQAWVGMTAAGGVEMPAEVAGIVALNEVVVHGWDIAAASGQPYEMPNELIEAARTFVQQAVDQNPEGTPGLFGPPVPVSPDASPIDQLIGLTGRDPRWAQRAAVRKNA